MNRALKGSGSTDKEISRVGASASIIAGRKSAWGHWVAFNLKRYQDTTNKSDRSLSYYDNMDVYDDREMVELCGLFAGYLSTVKKDTKEEKHTNYPINTQLQYLSNVKYVFAQHPTCKSWDLWRQHDDTEGWYKKL
jgi:hypothetical protein